MNNPFKPKSPEIAFQGHFAAYRVAGLRHIEQCKALRGVDPCVALKVDDPRLTKWRRFLEHEFGGRLPWEFRALSTGVIDSLTVPCEHPEALAPTLSIVRSEAT